MVSYHPAKFGGHCGSGDVMFLVVEGVVSTCPCFYSQTFLSLKELA